MEPARMPQLPLLDLHPAASDFRADVLAGLRAHPRKIAPMYFYDAEGSRLFDLICETDEYYPTRTELSILDDNMVEIVARLEDDPLIIEFGSGSSVKTRHLLDHLPRAAGYVPVDISRQHLMHSARELAQLYPDLEILPVCADFTEPFEVPTPRREPSHRVVFFPGSTIGNFEPDGALSLLRTIRADGGERGGLLIGVDLKKDVKILEAAYDDAQGVTAAFNRNLLTRIQRELGARLDVEGFTHRAHYDAELGRVEMHLVASGEQTIDIGDERFVFADGESLHTESSHKYEVEEFAALAAEAGLRLDRVWTDARGWFSVQLYWVDA